VDKIKKVPKKTIVLLIALLFITSLIGLSIRPVIHVNDPQTLVAAATVSSDISEVGEIIIFDSNLSKGNIHNVSWDFGNGDTYDEPSVSYRYINGGWYNVTLTVRDKEGNSAFTNVLVGIQMVGHYFTNHMDPRQPWKPLNIGSYGQSVKIGPNIGHPSIDHLVRIQHAMGQLEIELKYDLYEKYDDGPIQTITIVSESFSCLGSQFEWTYSLEPIEIPEEYMGSLCYVNMTISIGNSKISDIYNTIDIEFPQDIESRNI